MEHTVASTVKERILAVDALRGFAVMGIILLHNIEHFNFYSFPEDTGWLKALDTTLWDFLFFSFSGKAYAIFALLFGFTFYLQSRSAEKRGFQEPVHVAVGTAVRLRVRQLPVLSR